MSESTVDEKKDFIFRSEPHYTEGGAEGEFMIRHIDSELQGLKDLALQMGGCVEEAFENACHSVTARAGKSIEEVYKHEKRINSLQMQIDEACVNLLAKQAPVARDLRLVIAITKINTDLERMGDQCVNIARSARDLFRDYPSVALPEEITRMIEEVRGMVRSVLDAFARRDVELSQKILEQDDCVDELRDTLVKKMKATMKAQPEQLELGLGFIMIGKNLERMADHATNVAEDVIYFTTGNDVRHGHINSANS